MSHMCSNCLTYSCGTFPKVKMILSSQSISKWHHLSVLFPWHDSKKTKTKQNWGVQSFLPADVLWLQMWCSALLCPTVSHIIPANNTPVLVTGAEASTCTRTVWCVFLLTGNLTNKSMNIWAVSGLFLRLMKERRASLKIVETRSTSTLPMNCICTHQIANGRHRCSDLNLKQKEQA